MRRGKKTVAEALHTRKVITRLLSQGRQDEAWRKIRARLLFAPTDIWFLTEAARLSRQTGLYQQARRYYQQILNLRPDDAGALNGLGITCYDEGLLEQAAEYYRKALQVHPGYAACHNNYAILLHKQFRYAEALLQYQRALHARPDYPGARFGMSTVLAHTGKLAEAEQMMQQLLQADPENQRCRNALGMVQLQQGNFHQGWKNYRARYHPRNPDRFYTLSSYPQPYWQGETLEGKTILIKTEQGLGDEIQFCRFLPRLKTEKMAGRIIMIGRKALEPLLSGLPGVDLYLPKEIPTVLPAFDCWSMLLDLPGAFPASPEQSGTDVPYLFSSPEHQHHWPLHGTGMKVGLVWKGAPGHSNDRHRSLSHLTEFAPLRQLPGISWVSLQKGAGEEDVAVWPEIQTPGARFENYKDTAAIIAQLDLVISVDTSVIHLAGAMGKPCWVLLPAYARDWRWQQGKTHSLWYPQMRIFVRGEQEGWAAVIERVRAALHITLHQSRQSVGNTFATSPRDTGLPETGNAS
jgi:Tfp pilus assembly protein PilF